MRRPLRRSAFSIVSLLLLVGSASAESPKFLTIADEGRQPQACVDAQGRVHVAYGLGDEIRYVGLDEKGKPTGNPVIVAKTDGLALGMRRGPRIATDGKAIVILAIARSGPIDRGKFVAYSAGTLSAWRSVDGGRSWSGPVAINTVRGSAAEGMHALAAAPKGGFYAVWNDNRTQAMEVYGSASEDGATWTGETRIHRSPDRAICPCCHPSAAFAPDGSLHVMWRDQINGHRDMHWVRSSDGGRTFGLAEKLGEASWTFNACPMDGGAILPRSKDQVDTVWFREGRIFAAQPGKPERPLGRGHQAWGVATKDGNWFAWLDQRPGKLMLLKPGEKKATAIVERANDPMLAVGPGGAGPVALVWEEPAETPATPSTAGHGHGTAKPGPIVLTILNANP